MNTFAQGVVAVAILITATATAQDDLPSREEMWKVIQQQSKQIDALQKQVGQLTGQIDSVADAVEEGSMGAGGSAAWAEKTSFHGYGELHYNNLEDKNSGTKKDSVDYHRFVLMANHKFSDRVRLYSEIELEHSLSGDGKPGEVELEQAYIEIDLDDAGDLQTKLGLFLVPIGLMNETHEPPTFYGTERNSVEKNIIPATWWEAGAALNGQLTEELSYDVAYTSGLNVDPADFKIRDGRQKVAKAVARDGAWTGRLRYKKPGLELGTTLNYQTDITQGADDGSASALLTEAHAVITSGDFTLRALYARWDIDSDAAEDLGRDEQEGWYVEPSYRISEKLGIFARYSQWDTKAGNSADSEISEWSFGLSYFPHEDVVLKLDYQDQDAESSSDSEYDGINIGVGFQF